MLVSLISAIGLMLNIKQGNMGVGSGGAVAHLDFYTWYFFAIFRCFFAIFRSFFRCPAPPPLEEA